jgi:hypothetical protein
MNGPLPQPAPPSGSSDSRATKAHRNWFGVASVILGVIALPTSLLLFGGVFGLAALATGIVARGRVRHGKAGSPALATVGIALGAVSIIASVAALIFLYWVGEQQMLHYHQCFVDGAWRHC